MVFGASFPPAFHSNTMLLAWVTLLFCWISSAHAWSCSNNGTLSTHCIIFNQTVIITQPFQSPFIVGNGSLVLSHSTISVPCTNDFCPTLPLLFNMSGGITLVSSNISAPSIALISNTVIAIDGNSVVDAGGRGADLITSVGLEGSGGANGGEGARPWVVTLQGCQFSSHTTPGYGSLSGLDGLGNVYGPGGAALCRDNNLNLYTRGGGSILLHSFGNMSIDGSVIADGADAINYNSTATGLPLSVGGGAGGTIVIRVGQLFAVTSISITAQGGDGNAAGGGGGGGGRIALYFNETRSVVQSVAFLVAGGQSKTCGPDAGAGTLLFNSSRSVIVQGNPEAIAAVTYARTIFDESVLKPLLQPGTNGTWRFGSLRLLNANIYVSAVATAHCSVAELLIDSVLAISSSTMTIVRTPTPVRVSAGTSITFTKSRWQRCDGLHEFCVVCSATGVSCAAFHMEMNTPLLQLPRNSGGAKVTVEGRLHIVAQQLLVGGTIADSSDVTNNVLDTQSSLIVNAESMLVQTDGTVTVCFVRIHSRHLQIQTGASMQSLQNFAGDLDAAVPFDTCTFEPPAATGQINMWINSSSIQVSGVVSYSTILICADNMTVDASAGIGTSGLGALPQHGIGKGSLSSACASGAGHGSIGGFIPPCFPGLAYDESPLDFDNISSVALSVGSGGGSGVAGSGGGILYVHVRIWFKHNGLLDASGQPAIQTASGGAGGGSGGSLILSVSALVTDVGGKIHAIGGDGSNTGGSGGGPPSPISGGGGSGGVIWLRWLNAVPAASLLSQFDISVHGGQGAGGGIGAKGVNGGDGKMAAFPWCLPGYTGISCSPCAAGSWKNSSGSASCKPCGAGSAASSVGSAVCSLCSAGSFAASTGATSCSLCPGGQFSAQSGSTSCSSCPAGNFSDSGSTTCVACQPNSIAPNASAAACQFCLPGQFSITAPQTSCTQCNNAPARHFSYLDPGAGVATCAYQCDPGFVMPDCLSAFDRLVNSLGGIVFFSLIVLGAVVLLASPFFCIWYRRKQLARRQVISDLMDAGHLQSSVAADTDESSYVRFEHSNGATPTHDHRRNGGNDSTSLRVSLLDRVSLYQLDDIVASQPNLVTELQESDLASHLVRVYFQGYNSAEAPLQLSESIDKQGSAMASLVIGPRYSQFARDCAFYAQWEQWETSVYQFLSVLFYPFAQMFLSSRREVHWKRLQVFMSTHSHDFLSSYRARSLRTTLRLGASTDRTLVWLDILEQDSAHSSTATHVFPSASSMFSSIPASMPAPGVDHSIELLAGKPSVPLVLIASGNGSYFQPFHFDVSDALLKSLVSYFGAKVFSFVASLNSFVRPITEHDIRHAAFLQVSSGGTPSSAQLAQDAAAASLPSQSLLSPAIQPADFRNRLSAQFDTPNSIVASMSSPSLFTGTPPPWVASSPSAASLITAARTRSTIAASIVACLEYIEAKNHSGIGHGRRAPASGLRVDLGRVPAGDGIDIVRPALIISAATVTNQIVASPSRSTANAADVSIMFTPPPVAKTDLAGALTTPNPDTSVSPSAPSPSIANDPAAARRQRKLAKNLNVRLHGTNLDAAKSSPFSMAASPLMHADITSNEGSRPHHHVSASSQPPAGFDSPALMQPAAVAVDALLPLPPLLYRTVRLLDLIAVAKSKVKVEPVFLGSPSFAPATAPLSSVPDWSLGGSSDDTNNSFSYQSLAADIRSPKAAIVVPAHAVDLAEAPPLPMSCSQSILSSFASCFCFATARASTRARLTAILVLLLVIDCAAVFVASVTYLQPEPEALMFFAGLYPGASAAAPLIGFAALVSASPLVARLFVIVNALSLLNAACLLGWGIYAFIQRELPYYFALCLPAALLVGKFLMLQCTNYYIAHVDHSTDSKLARKDYLRHTAEVSSDASVTAQIDDVQFDRDEAKRDGFSFAGVQVPQHAHSPQPTRTQRR